MRLTRTVKICYLLSIPLLVAGAYIYSYKISLAEWEDPKSYHTIPREDWSPDFQKKAEMFIYPYNQWGIHVLFFAVGIFILTPTIATKISEANSS